jgi:hypothetical protein
MDDTELIQLENKKLLSGSRAFLMLCLIDISFPHIKKQQFRCLQVNKKIEIFKRPFLF